MEYLIIVLVLFLAALIVFGRPDEWFTRRCDTHDIQMEQHIGGYDGEKVYYTCVRCENAKRIVSLVTIPPEWSGAFQVVVLPKSGMQHLMEYFGHTEDEILKVTDGNYGYRWNNQTYITSQEVPVV